MYRNSIWVYTHNLLPLTKVLTTFPNDGKNTAVQLKSTFFTAFYYKNKKMKHPSFIISALSSLFNKKPKVLSFGPFAN